MKINLEINNLTQSSIENIPFQQIAEKVISERANFLAKKKVSLSVSWVGENEIKKLNKEYRKKDFVTDVLSFSEFESFNSLKKDENEEIFLGELILCYYDIEKYAAEEGVDLSKEIIKVFVHGLLHLLTFEHGKKMFQIQEEIVNYFLNKK